MPAAEPCPFVVIPLSIQKEGDVYLVGNSDTGDFYHFPEQGVAVLDMLRAGASPDSIKSRLSSAEAEMVDVDDFVDQLSDIGFIYPSGDAPTAQDHAAEDHRRIFAVDPRIARAIFSPPVLLCVLAITLYAILSAIADPDLRINFNAFYTETNRTALLILVVILSVGQVALHEAGHMLAAARHGVQSRYGVGNRLWTVVAESDLTGLLALPKAKRYFPMLAGLLVDLLCASLLTILLQQMLRAGVSGLAFQLVQALILEIFIGMTWQLNIFVKTDIYFVLCNYFSHPDLDREARRYIRACCHRLTFGFLGHEALPSTRQSLAVLRIFSLIWIVGRVASLAILLGVFLPTMARYIWSALDLLKGPPASIWAACDTLLYVSITLTMLGVGLYLWAKQKLS